MHRLMVLSSTYRQASTPSHADAGRPIPTAGGWSSFPRRRLDGRGDPRRDAGRQRRARPRPGTSESGELLYEKAEDIKSKIRPNRLAADDPFYTRFKKRTIYLPVVRNMLPDVLTLFDAADPNGVTAVRNDTTVARSRCSCSTARSSASRRAASPSGCSADGETTDESRIERAYFAAFGRRPTDRETPRPAITSRPTSERRMPRQARPEPDRRSVGMAELLPVAPVLERIPVCGVRRR